MDHLGSSSVRAFFFSHRGGTGRTTLLLNTAVALAQRGYRVCVVDFDFSAPGLSRWPAVWNDAATEAVPHRPDFIGSDGSDVSQRVVSALFALLELRRVREISFGGQLADTGETVSELARGGLWVAALRRVSEQDAADQRNVFGWPRLEPECVNGFLKFLDELSATTRADVLFVDLSPGLGFGFDLCLMLAVEGRETSVIITPSRLATQSEDSQMLAGGIARFLDGRSGLGDRAVRHLPALTMVPRFFMSSEAYSRRKLEIERKAFNGKPIEIVIPLVSELSVDEEVLTVVPPGYLVTADPYWHAAEVIARLLGLVDTKPVLASGKATPVPTGRVGAQLRYCNWILKRVQASAGPKRARATTRVLERLVWWICERADECRVSPVSLLPDPTHLERETQTQRDAQTKLLKCATALTIAGRTGVGLSEALEEGTRVLLGSGRDGPLLDEEDRNWLESLDDRSAAGRPLNNDGAQRNATRQFILRHLALERQELARTLRLLHHSLQTTQCRRKMRAVRRLWPGREYVPRRPQAGDLCLDDAFPVLATARGEYREVPMSDALAWDDDIVILEFKADLAQIARRLQRAAWLTAGRRRPRPAYVVLYWSLAGLQGWVPADDPGGAVPVRIAPEREICWPFANRLLLLVREEHQNHVRESFAALQRRYPGARLAVVHGAWAHEGEGAVSRPMYVLVEPLQAGLERWSDAAETAGSSAEQQDSGGERLVIAIENQAPGRALADVSAEAPVLVFRARADERGDQQGATSEAVPHTEISFRLEPFADLHRGILSTSRTSSLLAELRRPDAVVSNHELFLKSRCWNNPSPASTPAKSIFVVTGLLAYSADHFSGDDLRSRYSSQWRPGGRLTPPRTFCELLEVTSFLAWVEEAADLRGSKYFQPLILQHALDFSWVMEELSRKGSPSFSTEAVERLLLDRLEVAPAGDAFASQLLAFQTQWSMLARMLTAFRGSGSGAGSRARGEGTFRQALLRFLVVSAFALPSRRDEIRQQEAGKLDPALRGLDWDGARASITSGRSALSFCWNDTAELFRTAMLSDRTLARIRFTLLAADPDTEHTRKPTPLADRMILWSAGEKGSQAVAAMHRLMEIPVIQDQLLHRGAVPVDWLRQACETPRARQKTQDGYKFEQLAPTFSQLSLATQLSIGALRYGTPHLMTERLEDCDAKEVDLRQEAIRVAAYLTRLLFACRRAPRFGSGKQFDEWYNDTCDRFFREHSNTPAGSLDEDVDALVRTLVDRNSNA